MAEGNSLNGRLTTGKQCANETVPEDFRLHHLEFKIDPKKLDEIRQGAFKYTDDQAEKAIKQAEQATKTANLRKDVRGANLVELEFDKLDALDGKKDGHVDMNGIKALEHRKNLSDRSKHAISDLKNGVFKDMIKDASGADNVTSVTKMDTLAYLIKKNEELSKMASENNPYGSGCGSYGGYGGFGGGYHRGIYGSPYAQRSFEVNPNHKLSPQVMKSLEKFCLGGSASELNLAPSEEFKKKCADISRKYIKDDK